MPSFNRVTLIGNLTRDPEMRTLPGGTVVCEFGLAMNRHYKTAGGEAREETCFIDCTAFSKQAENLSKYVSRGKPLFVEGRLKYDQWDDKNGSGKRSKISIVVENFQFIGTREGSSEQPGHGDATPGGSAGRRRSTIQDAPSQELFTEADIPF